MTSPLLLDSRKNIPPFSSSLSLFISLSPPLPSFFLFNAKPQEKTEVGRGKRSFLSSSRTLSTGERERKREGMQWQRGEKKHFSFILFHSHMKRGKNFPLSFFHLSLSLSFDAELAGLIDAGDASSFARPTGLSLSLK